MFAIVYRCRREGELLDTEAVKARPARGELRVQRRGMKRIAVLLEPDGEHYVIPVLDKARLLAIDGRGLLLTGVEVLPPRGSKGNGTMYRQTWWCVYRQAPARTEISSAESRALERQRQAEAIGKSLTTHYSRRGKFSA